MKNLVSRFATLLALFAAISFVRGSAFAQTAQSKQNSIKAYDALFQTLKPGQKVVYLDDMGFRVDDLKKWRDHLASSRSSSGAFNWANNLTWPNRRVPYIFDGNMTESYRDLFRKAIFEWQKVSNIRWEPQVAGDTDYVRVRFNGSSGMNSFVGRLGVGEQTLNVDTSANLIRCVHEIGHCSGMVHEQNRSDRDTYITITSTSTGVDALKSVNWILIPNSMNRTAYDYDSLMHYPASACAGNPSACATMTPKEPFYTNAGRPTLGQETHISTGDAAAMANDYGAPCSIKGRVTTGGVAVPNITLTCTGTGGSIYYGPSVTTDANGNYTLPGVVTGTYSIAPSGGAAFTQSSRSVTINTTPVTGIDFVQLDTSGPSVSIAAPINNQPYKSLPTVSGTANDNTGVDYVVVVLSNNADGKWWIWNTNSWGSTTFDGTANIKKVFNASKSALFNWSTSLPSLTDGSYTVQAKAVDTSGNDIPYTARNYKLDNTGPTLSVTTPAHQGAVPLLEEISGTAFDATGIANSRVIFTLYQNGDFWTGTAWKSNTNAQDPAVQLQATVSATGTWEYNSVPSGSNLRQGTYDVRATATDTLGNISSPTPGANQNNFSVDTGPPTVGITTPANGTTVTSSQSSNWLKGTANDGVGVSEVRLYLVRLNGDGPSDDQFWDGTAWAGGGSAILPTAYNASTKVWNSSGPLPSFIGTNSATKFTNGSYNLIAFALDAAGNQTRADSVFSVDFHETFTWTAGSYSDNINGNENQNWNNPANWSPYGVPYADSQVLINSGVPNNTNMGSVTIYGVTLGDATLTTSGMLITRLNMSGGSLNGGAVNIKSGGAFNWTGGTMNGTFTVLAGATGTFSGDNIKQIGNGSTLDNAGTITWTGGEIRGYQNSTLNNKSGATFALAAVGAPFTNYYGGNTFNNQSGAILQKSGASGATTLQSWTFNNDGTIRNLLTNTSENALVFNGTLNLNDTTTIGGAGRTRLISGTLNLTGTTTVQGVTFEMAGGSLVGTGTMTATDNGIFEWTGGTVQQLTIATTGILKITGDGLKQIGNGGVINNFGTAIWTGTGELRGYQNSTFNNKNRGVFTAGSDATFSDYYGGNKFNNESGATFTKTGGTGNTHSQWAFNNNGTLRAAAGVVQMNGGGNSSGTFTADAAGIVRFTGGDHTLSGNAKFLGAGKSQITGGHVIAAGTIAAGTTTLPGTFEVSGGTLDGEGTFTGTSAFNWTGGTIGGNMTIAANSQLNLLGDGIKQIGNGGAIHNLGTAKWSGGELRGYQNSTFNNRDGATFDIAGDGSPFTNYAGGNKFNNRAGASFISSGAATTTITNWEFNNSGTIRPNNGQLDFTGRLNLNGGTVLAGTGKMRWAGDIVATAPLSSTIAVNLDGGNFNAAASEGAPAVTYDGTLRWTGGNIDGTFKILKDAKLDLTGEALKQLGNGAVLNNAGTITWAGPGVLRGYQNSILNNLATGEFKAKTDGDIFANYYGGNVFNNQDGTFTKSSGTGTTTVDEWTFNNNQTGGIVASTGTLLFNTTLNLNEGGVVAGSPTQETFIASTGTTNLVGETLANTVTFRLNGTINAGENAVLNTLGNGLIDWQGGTINGTLTTAPNSRFQATGDAIKQIGNGAVFNNKGNFTWISGELRGYQNATFNNRNGATFNAPNGGSLTNYYGGNKFSNAGTLKLGSELGIGSMAWSFAQTETGKLIVDLGGIDAANPLFDQWKIGGSAALDGTVKVNLINSFKPAIGNTFKVMTFASRTGEFATMTKPEGINLAAVYNPNDVTLSLTAPSYKISGKVLKFGQNALPVGVAGVQIKLDGADATLTDENGNYTLKNVAVGAHTVVAVKDGFSFDPASRSVTVTNANVTKVNFKTYLIYGRAVRYINGVTTGIKNVTVTLGGGCSQTATTDDNGNYSFKNLGRGSYSVSATKDGVSFSPVSKAVTLPTTGALFSPNQKVNFKTYSIFGFVANASGKRIAGVAVKLSTGATKTTDANGNFSFDDLKSGTYTVTPTQSGFSFVPANKSVTVPTADKNFSPNGKAKFTREASPASSSSAKTGSAKSY